MRWHLGFWDVLSAGFLGSRGSSVLIRVGFRKGSSNRMHTYKVASMLAWACIEVSVPLCFDGTTFGWGERKPEEETPKERLGYFLAYVLLVLQ